MLLLAAGLSRWPPLFALALRLVVSVSAVYLLTGASAAGLTRWAWTMTIVALLFNPIMPARFSVPAWRVVVLGTAVVFALWLTLVQGWPQCAPVARRWPKRRRRSP